jgi:hypothetical protein
MKNMKLITLVCTLALFATQLAFAQDFSGLDKSPLDAASYPSSHKVSDKAIKVIYSRPQLKGRELSKLVPNGKVWRTGANEAAEITFYLPMMAGETLIEPGTYSLFTIPGEEAWTIILNSEINLWGSYAYNQKNDVVRITAVVSKGETETFSIAFNQTKTGVDMHLGWGHVIATTSFSKAAKK